MKQLTPLVATSLVALLIVAVPTKAFDDDSIFEEEDIYNQALPPVPNTGLTVPGTKWCGPGNTARSYSDLGTQRETDTCCRAHDNCEEILEPKTTLHGFNNTGWFPILKCSCEQIFINCLQSINSMVSNTLGRVYFGTRSKCFAKGYPIKNCREYQKGSFRKRCVLYEVFKNRNKAWQMYDMPFYSISREAISNALDD